MILEFAIIVMINANSGDRCNYPNCALVDFYKNRKSIDDLPSLKKEEINERG